MTTLHAKGSDVEAALADASRDMNCYAVDSGTVAHDVREWCLRHGRDNALREAVWFSPHCRVPQLSIFDHWNN